MRKALGYVNQAVTAYMTAHIKNPRCSSVSQFISHLYKAQHVSGDTPPIIRSLKLH